MFRSIGTFFLMVVLVFVGSGVVRGDSDSDSDINGGDEFTVYLPLVVGSVEVDECYVDWTFFYENVLIHSGSESRDGRVTVDVLMNEMYEAGYYGVSDGVYCFLTLSGYEDLVSFSVGQMTLSELTLLHPHFTDEVLIYFTW